MRKTKRQFTALFGALLLLSALAGCGAAPGGPAEKSAETRLYTDDLGRQVEIPAEIHAVASGGTAATVFLASIAPDHMRTVSGAPGKDQLSFLPAELGKLPETGQLYGGKSTMNLETLIGSGAQVVIDIGEPKESLAADLDALQRQTGLPVLFFRGDLDSMESTCRKLGDLLTGKKERAGEVADLIRETLEMAENNAAKIPADQRVSVLFTGGPSGLDTNPEGSVQAQVLARVGCDNAVMLENISQKSGGNPINMEQLYRFDPDLILFNGGSIRDTVDDQPGWNRLTAVAEGRYCEIPGLPYNWLTQPPSLNMVMGCWWLGNLAYPDIYDYDMTAEAQRIFKVLWEYDLTPAEAEALLSRASCR